MLKQPFIKRLKSIHLIVVALLITVACLFPSLQNDWVNWDDDAYVLRNTMVQELSMQQVESMFTTGHQVGLYHPLTMLSLAIDHHFWEQNAFGYHLTNLLLHLLNVVLVFLFIKKLSKENAVALVVALLFGMHPMHVESVAWISARKDVLYTAFYLLALLSYINYAKEKRRINAWYLLALITFAGSLLSKSMAFTFPVILLLVDYVKQQRITLPLVLDKLPFVAMSAVALVVAKYGQQASDSMMAVTAYPLHKTVFIGTYNTFYYGVKAIAPAQLSPFHPFPFLEGIQLPWYYYVSALPFAGGLYFLYRAFRRHRKVFFGIAFFMITIGPVLQIIPFGKAVSAERYTYVAYIGLFYLIAIMLYRLVLNPPKRLERLQGIIVGLMVAWMVLLGAQTFQQSGIWKNGGTLWGAVIEQYPNHYFGYLNRGVYQLNEGELVQAKADLDQSITLNPNLAEGYYERGRWFEKSQNTAEAITDYSAAIALNPNYAKPYVNRGTIKGQQGDLEAALHDFDAAVKADSMYALAYLNLGLVHKMKGNNQQALTDFGAAIRIEPWNAYYYKHRGVLHEALNNHEAAINDFSEAIVLEPQSGEPLFLRSQVHRKTGSYKEALQDAAAAQKLGFAVPPAYLNELKAHTSN